MTTAVVGVTDEWVAAAMTDDEMVVELLLRLKHAQAPETADKPAMLPLQWGIRQRRSRTSRWGDGRSLKKEADSARGSPMTPLSWSAGSGSGGSGSPSAGTVDGIEETSRQATCSTSAGSRSKVVAANEITSACSKRSKRKKTYSELKDEESVLLKERLHLKKELATLRVTFKEQRRRNENLNRIKRDLDSDFANNMIPEDIDQTHRRLPSSHDQVSSTRHSSINKPRMTDKPASCGGFFLLPDLNMRPSEYDSVTETLYGTS